jgi:2,3-bisphosphoglycerate-dependent phosphoglycerate mutase
VSAEQTNSSGAVTLHLVRHGETPWNAEGRIQGQTPDVPLTARGRAQAQAVADALGEYPIGALIASDLLRAIETAEPLAARLALPIDTNPALREKNFGVLEGLREGDMNPQLRAMLDDQWHDPDLAIDGGESNRQVYDRVAGYFDALLSAPPAGEIALIAHGGSVRFALLYLQGRPVEDLTWTEVDNGSIHTLTVSRRR